MALQQSVNIYNALGIPGDVAFSGPFRAQPANLNSSGQAQTIGFAYTITSQSNPDPIGAAPNAITAQVGGTGTFAGILINSKEYAAYGTSAGPLVPTLNLPDNSLGDLAFMGEVYVVIPGPANIGDLVYFDTTTGALGTTAATAVGTLTQSTTTITVVTATAGNLGIGTLLTIAGANAVEIIAFGSGTGGAGTYTVNVSQTVTPAAAYSGASRAPSGKTFVPRGEISRFPAAAVSPTGLAVLKMTN